MKTDSTCSYRARGAASHLHRRPARRSKTCALVLGLGLTWLTSGCNESDGRTEVADTDPREARELLANAPIVTFLGDSITAGFSLPREAAFPTLLHARLTASGFPFRLVNAGVSGATTAGGVSRLDWLLRQKPAVLVVELGGNDALRGQPLKSLEANLRTIIQRARKAGCQVLLLGMRIPPSYGGPYAAGFAAVYTRLESELGVAMVPFFMEGVAGVPELNLTDGIHPTAEGHKRLADNVLPALRRLLAKIESSDDG